MGLSWKSLSSVSAQTVSRQRSIAVFSLVISGLLPVDRANSQELIRGDSDGSGALELTDAVRVLGFLFLGNPTTLACDDAADSNDSGNLDLTDAVFVLNFLFLGSVPPPPPFPDCGSDPSDDGIGCISFPPCAPPVHVDPPELDSTDPFTRDRTFVVSGSSLPGSTVEISGPSGQVTGIASDSGTFSLDVVLVENRWTRLYVSSIVRGTRSAPVGLEVIHDSEAPDVFLDESVADAEVLTETVVLIGRVRDRLTGHFGLFVEVNDRPANVVIGIGTNGTFEVECPLDLGENILTVVARDAAGNRLESPVVTKVTRLSPEGRERIEVDGGGQEGPIRSPLSQPITIRRVDAAGAAIAGATIVVQVVRSDGLLSAARDFAATSRTLSLLTDRDGEARVFWRLGSDAGRGNNRLEVSSPGVEHVAAVCASARPGPSTQINISSGNNQRVEVESPAPDDLRVWVSDGCNGVEGVPVTFTVTGGSGLVGGDAEVTVTTGSTGHAAVSFVLGSEPGNQSVRANFPGNLVSPAVFVAYGVERQEGQATSFSGLALDNAHQPIGGARCHLWFVGDDVFEAVSSEQGQFEFQDIPTAGLALLQILGREAKTLNGEAVPLGSFPNLSFEVVIIPGAQNALPSPALFPTLDPRNTRTYSTTEDTVLTVTGIEGLSMRVRAGSMSILGAPVPDGTPISLNQVHHDDVPMPMPDGAAPPFAWTLQPAGATFDPPIEITYPNMSGLAPGAVAYFLSFDHDTGKFEIVASGHVREDGTAIVSDRGDGLSISGWGCNCPPYSVTGECCSGQGEFCCEQDPAVVAQLSALRAQQSALWESADEHFRIAERFSQDGPSPDWLANAEQASLGLRVSWSVTVASFSALRSTMAICRVVCLTPTPVTTPLCYSCAQVIAVEGLSLVAGVGATLAFAYALGVEIDGFLNLARALGELALAANDAAQAAAIQVEIDAVCAALAVQDSVRRQVEEFQRAVEDARSNLEELQRDAADVAGEVASVVEGLERIRSTVQSWVDELTQYVDPTPQARGAAITDCVLRLPNGEVLVVELPEGSKCDQGIIDSVKPDPDVATANDAEVESIEGSIPRAEEALRRVVASHAAAVKSLTIARRALDRAIALSGFENWRLSVAGHSAVPTSDGLFTIFNISAADLFGPGGPGTPPDFLSDDFVRLTGTCTVAGETLYAFSDPFQITQRETFVVAELVLNDTPPPLPESIRAVANPAVLAVGELSQLTVTASLADGSEQDVTPRTSWTVYRTSNPVIATVSADGLVTPRGLGTVFITAVNDGATAVVRLIVAEDVRMTTVEGYVEFEDGSPAADVMVSSDLSDLGVTDIRGFFSADLLYPREYRTLRVFAAVLVDGDIHTAQHSNVELVPNAITDAGLLVLRSIVAQAVSWWPGDGNTNDAIGSNDGTLVGDATFAPGLLGDAFALDGSGDYVDFGNDPSLQVSSGDFSVMAWVRFNAVGGDRSIVDKMAPGVNENGWRLIVQADRSDFWFCFGRGTNGCVRGSETTVTSSTRYSVGEWYHVAATKSSETIALYINGILEEAKPNPGSIVDTNAANLVIGSYFSQGAFLNGLVDEILLYDFALAAEEIEAVFDSGKLRR